MTENEVGRRFQPSLIEAVADFRRKRTLVPGIVVSGQGEEVGLGLWKIGGPVARDEPCQERRSREIVPAGRRADVDFIACQVWFTICRP